MKTNYRLIFSTLILACFFASCGTKVNITPENKQKLFESIDCSEYANDELQMTLCLSYKNIKFNDNGLPEFNPIADALKDKFYINSKRDLDKADKAIKSYVGINANFGVEIPPFTAKKLKDYSVLHRQEMHNIHKVEDQYTSGYRYPEPREPPPYEVEEHVYFTWDEILDWMNRVKEGYTLSDAQLGWQVHFGEYGTGDSDDPIAAVLADKSHYKRRSTILIEVKKIEGTVLSDIPRTTSEQPETAYNLGTLYPPGNN